MYSEIFYSILSKTIFLPLLCEQQASIDIVPYYIYSLHNNSLHKALGKIIFIVLYNTLKNSDIYISWIYSHLVE